MLENKHGSLYSIHSGSTKMYHDLRETYCLERLKRDIVEFVTKRPNCQQEIQILTWRWKDINMDFLVGLPWTQKSYDSIWLVLNWLIKSTRFIPFKSTYLAEDYARIFLDDIVCHHGIPLSIISYRGVRFTSRFWRSFQKGLGTNVKLSTAFHPQTDGQAEGMIQTLVDMLRECIIYFKES